MKEISNIAKQAQAALEALQNGKTYSSRYVADRLAVAAESNSQDALICHMRDVFQKHASSNQFVNQKQIAEVYEKLYGMSNGKSSFRQTCGDLLPSKYSSAISTQVGAEHMRVPYEEKLEPLYGERSDLSDELSGVFDLNKNSSFSAHSDSAIKRAEKYTKLQLVSMGYEPTSVKAVQKNDHFILCSASVDTSDHMQVNIPVPVQLSNGSPTLPTHFIQDGGLVKLNKENVFVFVKDSSNNIKKTARQAFEGQRSIREFEVDTPFLPAALEKFAKLEDDLVAAATSFSPAQVRAATNVVALEFSDLVKNPQVKVASSNARTLTFDVRVPTASGDVAVQVPVDMPEGSPVIPTKFNYNGASYKINSDSLNKIASVKNESKALVSREVEEMSRLAYNQLMDRVVDGTSRGDLKLAEDALATINAKFGGEQYIAALNQFSSLLKHASGNSDREKLVKQALANGTFIRVPTSAELYCPKLGLPASKVGFDEAGRPVPLRRLASVEDIESTGASISSYSIKLS